MPRSGKLSINLQTQKKFIEYLIFYTVDLFMELSENKYNYIRCKISCFSGMIYATSEYLEFVFG